MTGAPSTLPTSDEIDRRLRIVAQLRNLCLSLGRAEPVGADQYNRRGADGQRTISTGHLGSATRNARP